MMSGANNRTTVDSGDSSVQEVTLLRHVRRMETGQFSRFSFFITGGTFFILLLRASVLIRSMLFAGSNLIAHRLELFRLLC